MPRLDVPQSRQRDYPSQRISARSVSSIIERCTAPELISSRIAGARNALIQSSPAGATSSRKRASVSIPRSPTSTTRERAKRWRSFSMWTPTVLGSAVLPSNPARRVWFQRPGRLRFEEVPVTIPRPRHGKTASVAGRVSVPSGRAGAAERRWSMPAVRSDPSSGRTERSGGPVGSTARQNGYLEGRNEQCRAHDGSLRVS